MIYKAEDQHLPKATRKLHVSKISYIFSGKSICRRHIQYIIQNTLIITKELKIKGILWLFSLKGLCHKIWCWVCTYFLFHFWWFLNFLIAWFVLYWKQSCNQHLNVHFLFAEFFQNPIANCFRGYKVAAVCPSAALQKAFSILWLTSCTNNLFSQRLHNILFLLCCASFSSYGESLQNKNRFARGWLKFYFYIWKKTKQ